jgi:6-pyruvoyltetrahydropterin/6-carboxytetrahydropterin synthase
LLLAEKCPFFEIRSRTPQEIEFLLCGKRYILPADEIVLLPMDNILTEKLAEEFHRKLMAKLESAGVMSGIMALELRIEEAPGQGASFIWRAK